ncbi:hypothetical protein FA13DRAFT_1674953, partial [Coprinellus micaceus]
MTKCKANGQEEIWRLTSSLLRKKNICWAPPEDVGDVLGAMVTDKSDKSPVKEGRKRLKTILIAESAWLIWTLRCTWIMDHGGGAEKAVTANEAGNRWTSLMNNKLNFDILSSNERRYKTKATSRKLVKSTWE